MKKLLPKFPRPRAFAVAPIPPLTADAVPLLMQGKWITDTSGAVSASLMNDMVVVVPRGVPGPVAISESAVFDLEDFIETYRDLRWIEMP